MVLGSSGSDLANRLSNKIYELCRSKTIDLPAFPDFSPTLNALREGCTTQTNGNFKVCVQQHAKLKILESMASKWVNTESLKDRAMDLIEKHNSLFNPDAEMWVEDRSMGCLFLNDSEFCFWVFFQTTFTWQQKTTYWNIASGGRSFWSLASWSQVQNSYCSKRSCFKCVWI